MGILLATRCDTGTVNNETTATKWYAAGLHFECAVCGRCCAGPGEGYIWVTRPEIERIAEHLDLTPEELRSRFLRRVGLRTTIVEHSITKDCIFLRSVGGTRQCAIYPVRPAQCRSWPFWPENLSSPEAWNRAALRCPGINRGRLYTCEDIERIRENRSWWESPRDTADSSKK
jgi:Fe-S-cluster containining protein